MRERQRSRRSRSTYHGSRRKADGSKLGWQQQVGVSFAVYGSRPGNRPRVIDSPGFLKNPAGPRRNKAVQVACHIVGEEPCVAYHVVLTVDRMREPVSNGPNPSPVSPVAGPQPPIPPARMLRERTGNQLRSI